MPFRRCRSPGRHWVAAALSPTAETGLPRRGWLSPRKAAPASEILRAQTRPLPELLSRNRAGYLPVPLRFSTHFRLESCCPHSACKHFVLTLAHYPTANSATYKNAVVTSLATCPGRVVKRRAGRGDR